ncbi:MAG: PAS domain-containing protein [Acidobacteria bacterium]|nr:PAS domain-containing protein [Acidobacteriota bacterium]
MNDHAWIESFPGAITVCDPDGVIVQMNPKAARTFEKDGGMALIGRNLIDCHPEPARSRLIGLLTDRRVNAYSIEKNGVKKLIYQAPWYLEDGAYGGIVELSIDIPFEMPHFIRGS